MLGISVNISTKAFCPIMFSVLCSGSSFYTFGLILGWVEIRKWRRWAELAYKSVTEDLPFLVQNECNSSPFDHQSTLIKDHLMGTAKNV